MEEEIISFVTKILWSKVRKLVDKLSSGEQGRSQSYKNIAQVPLPVLTMCAVFPYKTDRLAYHGQQKVREIQVILLNCLISYLRHYMSFN